LSLFCDLTHVDKSSTASNTEFDHSNGLDAVFFGEISSEQDRERVLLPDDKINSTLAL